MTYRVGQGKGYEHLLISELILRGHNVSTPAVDMAYDLLCETPAFDFIKVQVKSTSYKNGVSYIANVCYGGGKKLYDNNKVDVIAIYVIPEKLWYFIPNSLIKTNSIRLNPSNENTKFGGYKNNWKIFQTMKHDGGKQ